MVLYVTHYKNSVTRFLYSYFVQTPLTLWFEYFSRLIPSGAEFVNSTNLSSEQLSAIWKQAQTDLATKAFPVASGTGSPTHPPDPRALTVQPNNVAVVACPDEPVANLVKLDPKWSTHKDPSGTILQLTGFQYNTVAGFSTATWKRPRVYAPASAVAIVLPYEFANIIMAELGYDVSQR